MLVACPWHSVSSSSDSDSSVRLDREARQPVCGGRRKMAPPRSSHPFVSGSRRTHTSGFIRALQPIEHRGTRPLRARDFMPPSGLLFGDELRHLGAQPCDATGILRIGLFVLPRRLECGGGEQAVVGGGQSKGPADRLAQVDGRAKPVRGVEGPPRASRYRSRVAQEMKGGSARALDVLREAFFPRRRARQDDDGKYQKASAHRTPVYGAKSPLASSPVGRQ
jgi:hypothetical protein